jgi:hypothetical protein
MQTTMMLNDSQSGQAQNSSCYITLQHNVNALGGTNSSSLIKVQPCSVVYAVKTTGNFNSRRNKTHHCLTALISL